MIWLISLCDAGFNWGGWINQIRKKVQKIAKNCKKRALFEQKLTKIGTGKKSQNFLAKFTFF